MNCFSHAFRFLDRDPYFIVGTCVPDWLALIDRKTRVRERLALQQIDDPDHAVACLARGIVQHHRDDHWFHGRREFVELNLQLALELREHLGRDAGFRPHLASHILIEVLLDSFLTKRDISRLDEYYATVAAVDPQTIESAINRIAIKSTNRIADFVPRFVEEAYLYDYVDDIRVRYRLNRVLQRVGLAELPETVLDWLPSVRRRVYEQADAMLTPPADSVQNPIDPGK